MTAGSPAAAAWAAVALARLPVDAQATVPMPNSIAFDTATETTRSLNDSDGVADGVVLDPDLLEAEPLGEPVGAHERRHAGLPGRPRAGRRAAAAPRSATSCAGATRSSRGVSTLPMAGVVVGDLQRAEAELADVDGGLVVGVAALAAGVP